MREIIVVGYETYTFAKSLVVGEIDIFDLEIDLLNFDYLLFTSKHAIYALDSNAQKYPQMKIWKQIPSCVIGRGSAKALEKLGGNLAFIPSNFHAEAFIDEVIPLLRQKTSLYLRGESIVSNLDTKLQKIGVSLVSQIIYKSRCKSNISQIHKPNPDSILLFTSPSAFYFFRQFFIWDESYIAVALGKTTFQSFDPKIQKFLSPYQDIEKSVFYLKKKNQWIV